MRVKFKKQINRYKFYRTLRNTTLNRSLNLSTYVIRDGNIVTHRYTEFVHKGFLYRCMYDFSKDLPNHEKFYRYNLKELK